MCLMCMYDAMRIACPHVLATTEPLCVHACLCLSSICGTQKSHERSLKPDALAKRYEDYWAPIACELAEAELDAALHAFDPDWADYRKLYQSKLQQSKTPSSGTASVQHGDAEAALVRSSFV